MEPQEHRLPPESLMLRSTYSLLSSMPHLVLAHACKFITQHSLCTQHPAPTMCQAPSRAHSCTAPDSVGPWWQKVLDSLTGRCVQAYGQGWCKCLIPALEGRIKWISVSSRRAWFIERILRTAKTTQRNPVFSGRKKKGNLGWRCVRGVPVILALQR